MGPFKFTISHISTGLRMLYSSIVEFFYDTLGTYQHQLRRHLDTYRHRYLTKTSFFQLWQILPKIATITTTSEVSPIIPKI
jgi:hypothetical protein